MAIDSLKDWKKIETPSSAERRHRENASDRNRDRRTDERKAENPLTTALANYKSKPVPKRGDGAKGDATPTKGKTAHADSARKGESPSTPTHLRTHALTHPRTSTPPAPDSTSRGENGANRSSVSTTANIPTSTVTSPATSSFVVGTQKPALTALLLKGSNAPATPPKTEEKKSPSATSNAGPNAAELQQAVGAKGVPAPADAQSGAKMGGRKTENGNTETRRHGDTENGKRKTESGKRKTENGGARGAMAAEAGSADGGGALEAASAGVTSDGDGPVWIADMKRVGYTVNAGTGLEEDFSRVRDARDRFNKYLAKCVDCGNEETVRLFAKAVELDEKLGDILKRGLALRKNVYGGMNG